MKKIAIITLFANLFLNLLTHPVLACSVCFGNKDSDLTKGLNMAIITMLFVLMGVFGLVIRFLVQFNRRAKLMNTSG